MAEDGAGEDAATVGTPGDDELVWIYEQTPVFFSGWEEGQNQRQVDVTVTLPGEEFTESIEFAFALGCPNGDRCDFWDRLGSVGLVQNGDGGGGLHRALPLHHALPHRRELAGRRHGPPPAADR